MLTTDMWSIELRGSRFQSSAGGAPVQGNLKSSSFVLRTVTPAIPVTWSVPVRRRRVNVLGTAGSVSASSSAAVNSVPGFAWRARIRSERRSSERGRRLLIGRARCQQSKAVSVPFSCSGACRQLNVHLAHRLAEVHQRYNADDRCRDMIGFFGKRTEPDKRLVVVVADGGTWTVALTSHPEGLIRT